MATGGIALLAGADSLTAGRLALAMLSLQVSIGALNDAVDAPVDTVAKPGKPVPQGLVGRRTAVWVALFGGGVGLGLAAMSGLPTLAVALTGAALGWVYDLRLSRTPASWLPLSLALPLLPVFAWLGATGAVPPGLVTLVPVAVAAGAALGVANGIVDLERDARAGLGAIVVVLGRWRAWLLQTGLLGLVAVLAALLAPVPAAEPAALAADVRLQALAMLRASGVSLGIGLLGAGAAALWAARPSVRERGWELEALGVAALGLGWLAGTAGVAAGALRG